MTKTKVLVISRNIVGERMSAPGIRALNIARTLAKALPEIEVTLAAPNKEGLPAADGFEVVTYGRMSLPGLITRSDVIVSQYVPSYALPFILGKRLVLDFFANFIAEWLELWAELRHLPSRNAAMDTNRRYLNLQLSQADLVLAANERQRDLWLGALAAIGRVSTRAYDADPTLRNLVDVAPFGIRPQPAEMKNRVLKGVYPRINSQDRVLLWNGGVLHWYDPNTLLLAFDRVVRQRPNVRLFFLGTKYPVHDPIEGKTLTEMLALSERLGLTDRSVFFNEGWLPYDDTADYLIEADIGVCTYMTNLETHFAYRVRLIDLIWAETPIICNKGDTVAEMVEANGLGLTVPQGDVEALADAIVRILDDESSRARFSANERALKRDLSWEQALAPLIKFCRELPEPSASRSLGVSATHAASYAWQRSVQMGIQVVTGVPLLLRGQGGELFGFEQAPVF